MKRAWIVFAVLFLRAAVPAHAQSGKEIADWASTGLVGVDMAAEAIHDFRNGCGGRFILKNGISIASAEILKRVVHEERPNHYDNKSWPSEHSWLAAVNSGWNIKVGFTIALGAGAGRVLSDFHHPWDVASGLLFGALIDHYIPCRS